MNLKIMRLTLVAAIVIGFAGTAFAASSTRHSAMLEQCQDEYSIYNQDHQSHGHPSPRAMPARMFMQKCMAGLPLPQ